jgi:predicted AlkP superfamily phosphohydrolase/phosphomutase
MSARLLMVALDAAEPALIERWIADGSMPNLGRLRAAGSYGRLASPAAWLAGSVWPAFYTSASPADTGFYHYLQWRPDRLVTVRPDPALPGLVPFWRRLAGEGLRVLALDMPLAPTPMPIDGLELCGWATVDSLEGPRSFPPDLLGRVCAEHGEPPRRDEHYVLEPVEQLLAMRDEHIRIARTVADLALGLMRRDSFDLLTVCLPGPHRCGHRLWDDTGVLGEVPAAARDAFDDALHQVYIAADEALGRLLDATSTAEVMVFSVHGMGPNTSRLEILDEMLTRVLATGDRRGAALTPSRRLAERLRTVLPANLRAGLKQRLPVALQDRLTGLWRTGGVDWARTRAASLVGDVNGYLQLNLQGREARGIVRPGPESVELVREIADGFLSFVDYDTGAPVVAELRPIGEIFGRGECLHQLPDLVVRWAPTPAAQHRGVVSPRFGEIAWPTPGRHPTGRSGNHRGQGFLIATGRDIPAGGRLDGADIHDLAPTAYRRLGLAPPAEMRGRALF